MTHLQSSRKILAQFGFKKVRRFKRLADGMVKDEIVFPLHGGGCGRLEISPSLQTPGKLAAKLQDNNAALPAAEHKRQLLLQALRTHVPKRLIELAAQSGWSGDFETFVAQERIIGTNDADVRGMEPDDGGRPGRLQRSGTLAAWRRSVARPTGESSMLMTCIAAAFAAPLLPVYGEPSFGLCIFGESRIGKTVGTLVAASVIGLGKPSDLPSWNMTEAGLESLLPRFRHLLTPVDDVMGMAASGRTRDRDIERIAYKLTGGQAKLHQEKYDREAGRVAVPWCSVLLTTSEQSLVAAAGGQRQKGATVRLIDVPAILNGEDIFDRLPKARGTPERATVRGQLFKELFAACEAHHGTALEAYLEHLVRHREELAGSCRDHVTAFCQRVKRPTDGDLTRDLARKFGLLYAGAMLAREAGIVGWSDERVKGALTRAYRGARDLLPDDDARDLREGRRSLTALLRSLPQLEKRHRANTGLVAVELTNGYRFKKPEGRFALVRVEKFQAAFASVRQRKLVEDWLAAAGRVEMASAKIAGRTGPRMRDQHIWPDGRRVRSLLMRRPLKSEA